MNSYGRQKSESMPAKIIPFQAAFSALVNAAGSDPSDPTLGGHVEIDESGSVFTWYRTTLPYTVPEGFYLCITDVHFGSKNVNHIGTRSSYLILPNIMSVTESGPTISLKTPFIVPTGQVVRAVFFNNSPEEQWMNGFITGRLSKKPWIQ
jgi:hypothetical protein